MAWKAILAGRENDPSFLLKSLVADIEKSMERMPRPSPFTEDMDEGKKIEQIGDVNDAIRRSMYLYYRSERNEPKEEPKLTPEESKEVKTKMQEGLKKDIENYYEQLKKKVSSQKLEWKDFKKEWLIDNFYFSEREGEKPTINRKFFGSRLPKKLSPKHLDPLSNPVIRANVLKILIFEDKELQPKYKEAVKALKKANDRLKAEKKFREKIAGKENPSDKELEAQDIVIHSAESAVLYAKEDVDWLKGKIAEVKGKGIPEKELYSIYGGKAKFEKLIKDSKIAFLERMKLEEMKHIDEVIEKIQNEIKEVIDTNKDTISFMEIYSDIEGESELKDLKSLLQDEEMKSFFNSLKEVKYAIPIKWEEMSEKQQNSWKLQNKRKFQDSYQRILKNLNALKNKYSSMESSLIIRRKIDNITSVINTLVKRYNMKNWAQDRREDEERKRERGTGSYESKFQDSKRLQESGKSPQLTDEQREAREKFESEALYEVLFSDPEFLDRGSVKSKVKSILPASESKVSPKTKQMWSNFVSKLETFTKSKNPEKDFNKFIASDELYFIDVVNLLQTKRNPKKFPKRKVVVQKPKEKEKKPKKDTKEFSELTEEEQKRLEERTKRQLPPSPKKVKKSYVPREMAALAELMGFSDDTMVGTKPIGSNKEAMKRRMKSLGKKYRQAMFTNYKKLREDMNKINTDEFDKYFSQAKTVMDADLFSWIDKTSSGIGLRPFSYSEDDKGFAEIQKFSNEIMKLLNSNMEYEGNEIKVLDLINQLARKTYKRQAGSIVSEKRKRVAEGLKEIKESTVRIIQGKKKEDFQIPRLLKLKIKQDNLRLKKELYNLFRGAESPLGNNELSQIRIVERTDETIDELTEIEKRILSKWKELSDAVAELAKPEIKAREESSKRKLYAKALSYVVDFEVAIEPAKRSIDILEQEVIAFSEMLEKEVSNEKKIKRNLKDALRLLKRKQGYIDKVQIEIDRWQTLADKIEKDLEE